MDPVGLLEGIALISLAGEISISDCFEAGWVDEDFLIGLKDFTAEEVIFVYRLGYK